MGVEVAPPIHHLLLQATGGCRHLRPLCGILGLVYNRAEEKSLDDEIEALIEQRNAARKAKNWAEADRIRDELKARNIILEDTPQGVKWKYAE